MNRNDGAERRRQIKELARELYALAKECGVPMLPACSRIGMATSTPHRWLNEGSEPKEGQLDALRASILRMSSAAGLLPKKYQREFDKLGPEQVAATRRPSDIARNIVREASELQRALAAE